MKKKGCGFLFAKILVFWDVFGERDLKVKYFTVYVMWYG